MPKTKFTESQIDLIMDAGVDDWQELSTHLPPGTQKGNVSLMRQRRGLEPFSVVSYSYNNNFFYEGSLRACYWAGFIAADGCVRKNGGKYLVVSVALKATDYKHLEELLNDLGGGRVRMGTTKLQGSKFDVARVNVCNADIYQGLVDKFNITERKSLTLNPPKGLSKAQNLAFIAGYIDGDGSYTYSPQRGRRVPVISILGTEQMLHWIKVFFGYSEKSLYDQGKIKELKFYGKDAIDVRSQLHTLKNEIPFLPRKYKRWESLGIDISMVI